MDQSSLRIKCLELAIVKSAHLGPKEVIMVASEYEDYVLGKANDSKGTPSAGNSQEPVDSVKEHKKQHSKNRPL